MARPTRLTTPLACAAAAFLFFQCDAVPTAGLLLRQRIFEKPYSVTLLARYRGWIAADGQLFVGTHEELHAMGPV